MQETVWLCRSGMVEFLCIMELKWCLSFSRIWKWMSDAAAARFRLLTDSNSSSSSPKVKSTEGGEGKGSLGLPNWGFQTPTNSWTARGDRRLESGPAGICRGDKCWRTYSVREGEEEDKGRELLELFPFNSDSPWGYVLGILFFLSRHSCDLSFWLSTNWSEKETYLVLTSIFKILREKIQ